MDKFIILGHENPDVDSIVSGYLLEKVLNKKGYNSEFVIPDKMIAKDTVNICLRYGLEPSKFMKKIDLNDKNNKYILVDHNERKLNGEIVCIIDHHPTSKVFDMEYYYNTEISSTACYICYKNENLLDIFDKRLAVVATLVDTASFHSTKSRVEDKNWVLDICNKYEFDYDELYKEGLCLTSLDDINRASLNGLKKYNFNEREIESSYIQVESHIIEEEKIKKIIDILRERINRKKLDAFVFIVYDMKKFKTMYYLITENSIQNRYYDFYASRGNTIIPEIEKKLK